MGRKAKIPSPWGTISVYLTDLGEERYRLRGTVHGVRKSCGVFDTVEEACARARAFREVVGEKSAGLTLAMWAAEWLKERETDGQHRNAADDRRRWDFHIGPEAFVYKPMRKITREEIVAWVYRLQRKPAMKTKFVKGEKVLSERGHNLSRQTVKNILGLLRACLAEAVEAGRLATNPAEGVKVKKRKGKTVGAGDEPTVYLDLEETRALLSCDKIPVWRRDLFQVRIYTGLRPGECWGLHWEDVDLSKDDPHLMVRFSFRAPPKNGKTRRVELLPPAREALLRHRDRGGVRRSHGLVWTSHDDGTSMFTKGYTCEWARWSKRAGVKELPFYNLRHTCGAHLVMGTWADGMPLAMAEVAKWLGHGSVTTTEKYYAHLAPDYLKTVRERMEKVWKGH